MDVFVTANTDVFVANMHGKTAYHFLQNAPGAPEEYVACLLRGESVAYPWGVGRDKLEKRANAIKNKQAIIDQLLEGETKDDNMIVCIAFLFLFCSIV